MKPKDQIDTYISSLNEHWRGPFNPNLPDRQFRMDDLLTHIFRHPDGPRKLGIVLAASIKDVPPPL